MEMGGKRKRVPAEKVEYFKTKGARVVDESKPAPTAAPAPAKEEPGMLSRLLKGDLPLIDEEAVAAGMTKGVTAGFDDDLAAAAAQAGAGAGRLQQGGNAAQAIGDAATAGKEAMAEQRKWTDAAYERSPISYGLGFVPGALVMGRAGAAPAGATRLRQVAGFAVPGAAAGVGMGDAKSLPEAGVDAAIGGALGVAGGMLAPKILRAVGDAGSRLSGVLRAKPSAPPTGSPVPSEVPLPSPKPPMTAAGVADKAEGLVSKVPSPLRRLARVASPERAKVVDDAMAALRAEDDVARRAREFAAQMGDDTPEFLKPPLPATPSTSAAPPSSLVPDVGEAGANLASPISNKAAREMLDAELDQVGAQLRSGRTPDMNADPDLVRAMAAPRPPALTPSSTTPPSATSPGRVLRKRVDMPAPRPDPEAIAAPITEQPPPSAFPTDAEEAAKLAKIPSRKEWLESKMTEALREDRPFSPAMYGARKQASEHLRSPSKGSLQRMGEQLAASAEPPAAPTMTPKPPSVTPAQVQETADFIKTLSGTDQAKALYAIRQQFGPEAAMQVMRLTGALQ